MTVEAILFYLVAAGAVASAVFMITSNNPVKSVLFLIVNFFCLAVTYLILHAQFIAIIQILVYAGAIMVLFLFVLMLLNVGNEERHPESMNLRRTAAVCLACMVLFLILVGIGFPDGAGGPGGLPASALSNGTVETIGAALFSTYLLPFEITSLLLLGAMVGVIVLAKKHFE
jgi:NADH-quinone oxidoreductase subunit J